MSAADDRYNRSAKGYARQHRYNRTDKRRTAQRERRRRQLGWYDEGGMATEPAQFRVLR